MKVRAKIPPRLAPVRDLLEARVGTDERDILDTWIAEETSWPVARDLWLLTKPTEFQQRITLMVVGRGSVAEHYKDGNIPSFLSSFAEAKRQLTIHPHALWARVIERDQQTSPRGDEVLIDHMRSPNRMARDVEKVTVLSRGRYRRRSPDEQAARSEEMVSVVPMRARCNEPGCIVESYPTWRVPEIAT